MTLHIVTANRLRDGLVVFRAGDAWSRDIADAQAFQLETATALVARVAAEERTRVVGAYAVEIGADGLPARTRERIRALGPTVRPDRGGRAGGR